MSNGIQNDYYMDFVLNTGEDCFRKCFNEFTKRDLTQLEEECVKTCYNKSFLSLQYWIKLQEGQSSLNSK